MGFLEDAFICGTISFFVLLGLLVFRLIQMRARKKNKVKYSMPSKVYSMPSKVVVETEDGNRLESDGPVTIRYE
jgi:hypothetical protein